MKKEVRWNLFRMATILQLLFSSLLSATLLFQSLRNPPKGELVWIITGWFFILLALAGLAALHTHILYRYYPDRLVPRLLVTLRIIFTILSWVAVIILSLAFGSLIVNESAWEKFNLTLRIVFVVLFLLTIVSTLGLFLQMGLIKQIKRQYEKSLLETINQIGEQEYTG